MRYFCLGFSCMQLKIVLVYGTSLILSHLCFLYAKFLYARLTLQSLSITLNNVSLDLENLIALAGIVTSAHNKRVFRSHLKPLL
jgi:hypothetical protein